MTGFDEQTPEEVLARARALANQLLTLPEDTRREELQNLKQQHQLMHALVLTQFKQMRS